MIVTSGVVAASRSAGMPRTFVAAARLQKRIDRLTFGYEIATHHVGKESKPG
jgi:hypothetical protein